MHINFTRMSCLGKSSSCRPLSSCTQCSKHKCAQITGSRSLHNFNLSSPDENLRNTSPWFQSKHIRQTLCPRHFRKSDFYGINKAESMQLVCACVWASMTQCLAVSTGAAESRVLLFVLFLSPITLIQRVSPQSLSGMVQEVFICLEKKMVIKVQKYPTVLAWTESSASRDVWYENIW